MITYRVRAATLFVPQSEIDDDQARKTQKDSTVRCTRYTSTRQGGQRLGKWTPSHGCARPAQSEMDLTDHLGAAARLLRLPGNASALQPALTDNPLNPTQRIEGSGNRQARRRRRLDADRTWAKSETSLEVAYPLVGQVGHTSERANQRLGFICSMTQRCHAA